MTRPGGAFLVVAVSVASLVAPPRSATRGESMTVPECAGQRATIVGTDDNNVLAGTPGPDVIVALGGNDHILGRGGNDLICGGAGRDILFGGDGADRLRGGPGNDRLFGGGGRDALRGWTGDDRLHGGPGKDVTRGGPGLDLCVSPAPPEASSCENTTRVSVSSRSREGDRLSGGFSRPAMSADGRFVAFTSDATNLVRGDSNGATDVFVRDRRGRTTERVSVSSTGRQANGGVLDWDAPGISADGRYVAFSSQATNLVAKDTNGSSDVFVRDRRTGTTTRVSVTNDGDELAGSSSTPVISADGRYVAFSFISLNDVGSGVYIHDRRSGVTRPVSVGRDGAVVDTCCRVAISAHGRYVAFSSVSGRFVQGDTRGRNDVFVRDLVAGTTARVSISSTGAQGNGDADPSSFAMTPDGRYVLFTSRASNLVPRDTNHRRDTFLHDRVTGATTRVSVSSAGAQAGAATFAQDISANGRFVAFVAWGNQLVPHDTNNAQDVLVRDRATGATRRVSLATSSRQADGDSVVATLTADGRYAAFTSAATNLVSGDRNDQFDVFVRILR